MFPFGYGLNPLTRFPLDVKAARKSSNSFDWILTAIVVVI
jgi:hypothetical protein